MMDRPARLVRLTATVVSLIWAVVLYVSGLRLENNARHALAYVPSVLGLAAVAFDKWAWKWPGIRRLVGRPRLDGTWRGVLLPSPDSNIPEGGNRGPIDTAIVIEQSYWSISVTLLTSEGSSLSSAEALRRNGEATGRRVLTYIYGNEPKLANRPRSQPHTGAARLTIVGPAPTAITGAYWTDRLTRGDIELYLVNRQTDYPNLAAVPDVTTEPVGGH